MPALRRCQMPTRAAHRADRTGRNCHPPTMPSPPRLSMVARGRQGCLHAVSVRRDGEPPAERRACDGRRSCDVRLMPGVKVAKVPCLYVPPGPSPAPRRVRSSDEEVPALAPNRRRTRPRAGASEGRAGRQTRPPSNPPDRVRKRGTTGGRMSGSAEALELFDPKRSASTAIDVPYEV